MSSTTKQTNLNEKADTVRQLLGAKVVVLVGLMGAGKSTVGRKVATMLGLPFRDADNEIESAARMTVPELFEAYGEAEFRDLERRVILRLLEDGPMVLATGGGAYMNAETREAIAANGVSVWLNAELDVLMDRVSRRQNRPLLRNDDPRGVMRRLMNERYPVYALADLHVMTRDDKKEVIAGELIDVLAEYLAEHLDKK
ncbi:shikimate kinase [Ochrobactrum quorumnocens]|uniref:Shikimate kinase n=1 Tax=Ochrobactrum quorumnocens TaxID=271865 RepID=A0A248ULG5_9HYPH|nr:shikimate kinase [[Ochrobactrum] quorumnocens]ASV87514.1 AAA domain protein [[Ochrobactrum] quorumnocens]KAA9369252.1 shikimate kinase [[Ochrobactrum] quorumnocens]MBD7991153.1 shikimate kinase [Ochrobactrum gallinarum]